MRGRIPRHGREAPASHAPGVRGAGEPRHRSARFQRRRPPSRAPPPPAPQAPRHGAHRQERRNDASDRHQLPGSRSSLPPSGARSAPGAPAAGTSGTGRCHLADRAGMLGHRRSARAPEHDVRASNANGHRRGENVHSDRGHVFLSRDKCATLPDRPSCWLKQEPVASRRQPRA